VGNLFVEITVVICLAAVLSIVFRAIKQPAVLAYILTGMLIGPFGHFKLVHAEVLETLAQLGVTLLLFMLGLELKFKELKSIGRVAMLIGVLQIALSFGLAFFISFALHYSTIVSFYVGIALSFSSTIIIVKLLSDKKDLRSLYGKISVGILLIQDVVAIFVLMFLSGFQLDGTSSLSQQQVIFTLAKGILLFGLVILLSYSIVPKIMHHISASQETLLLVSLAWVFLMASFVSSESIGFPIEIGGFLAGLALANSSENIQIVARVRALRDFFIVIFFVMLGMHMSIKTLSEIFWPAVALSLFVILYKPLLTQAIMGFLGYKKRTAFLTALNSSQISEFSLIIIFLGNRLGHVPESVVSIVTLVGIITFTVSSYLILYGNSVFKYLHLALDYFERNQTREDGMMSDELDSLTNHVALIGAHRMGETILQTLTEEGEQVVVIDFDPDVVQSLRKKQVLSVYGDISDSEILERVRLEKAKLVVSTVPDVNDNLSLIRHLKGTRTKVIVMALDIADAKKLYKAGADYVVMPHLVGGRHLAKLIKDDKLDHLKHFKSLDLP
jgi:Kef-type K+ transport system membrane component KefB